MKTHHKLAAIAVALLWGLNLTVSKVALSYFPPFFYGFLRYAVILPLLMFVPRPSISWRYIVALGILWGPLQFSFLNFSLYLGTSSGILGILIQSGGIFIMLFSYILYREQPRSVELLGSIICIIGVITIAWDSGARSPLLGVIFGIMSAACWALGNVITKREDPKSNFKLIVWSSISAAPLFLILSLLFETDQIIQSCKIDEYILTKIDCAIYTGWVALVLGGYLWLNLFQKYKASKVIAYTYLIPLFAIISGFLILKESFQLNNIIGGIVILVGLLLSQSTDSSFNYTDKNTEAEKYINLKYITNYYQMAFWSLSQNIIKLSTVFPSILKLYLGKGN